MQLRILNIALRDDGKYNAELSVVGSVRNQKVILTLEEDDLTTVLKNVKEFVDANPDIEENVKMYESIKFDLVDEDSEDEVSPEAAQAAQDDDDEYEYVPIPDTQYPDKYYLTGYDRLQDKIDDERSDEDA